MQGQRDRKCEPSRLLFAFTQEDLRETAQRPEMARFEFNRAAKILYAGFVATQ